MVLPATTITIEDPGLGVSVPAAQTPWIIGGASKGTNAKAVQVTNPQAAVDEWGEGPLVDAVCYFLQVAGGPVIGQKIETTPASPIGALDPTRIGSSTGTVTAGGSHRNLYEIRVKISKAGAPGVSTFEYSLDGGASYSPTIQTPASGSYALADTGITLTFANAVDVGDTFAKDVVTPHFATTGLSDCITALKATTFDFSFVTFAPCLIDAAHATTTISALAGHMSTLEKAQIYTGVFVHASSDADANVLTAMAAVSSTRVAACAGQATIAAPKPIVGRSLAKVSAAVVIGAHAAASEISSRLGRVRSGPLVAVSSITRDERLLGTMNKRFATLRTHEGRAGFYVTQGQMLNPQGSDYRLWVYRRVMDVACTAVARKIKEYIELEVRTKADGTIDDRDAAAFEAEVYQTVAGVLLEPRNASGHKGHVSAVSVAVDRTNKIVLDDTLYVQVSVRPLGYASFIKLRIGFKIGGEE